MPATTVVAKTEEIGDIKLVFFERGQMLKLNIFEVLKNALFLKKFGEDATFKCLGMGNADKHAVALTRHAHIAHVEVLTGKMAGAQTQITTAYLVPA